MKKNRLKRFASLSVLITTLTVSVSMPFTNTIHAAGLSRTEQNVTNSSTTMQATDTAVNSIWPNPPEVSAGNFILIDADTGAILYQKNANQRCFPASTTKILTGLLTIENCNMNETVTFSSEAANSVKWDEANLGTKPGEQYTVEQALYGLLLYSANEMAYGLAEHVAGSLSAFVDMMNERAKEAGAKDTHFNNASGLYDPNHYTTPYDLAMIARVCYNNATFIGIDSTSTTYTIPPTNVTPTQRTFQHRHQMLKGRPYYYEYCKGGKTGFTDESKYTLVTFAEKDDMRLIAVCMNGDADGRFTDTRTVFDWGFNNFKKVITTSDTVTSTLSNSNYYYSNVFSNNNIFFNLDVSSLTIPNNASVADVAIQSDESTDTTDENGTFKTNLKFVYGSNIVGTADLAISASNKINENNNLPFIDASEHSNSPTPKRCFVVNVWILGGIAVVVIISYYVIMNKRRSRRRSSRYYTRRRRF